MRAADGSLLPERHRAMKPEYCHAQRTFVKRASKNGPYIRVQMPVATRIPAQSGQPIPVVLFMNSQNEVELEKAWPLMVKMAIPNVTAAAQVNQSNFFFLTRHLPSKRKPGNKPQRDAHLNTGVKLVK